MAGDSSLSIIGRGLLSAPVVVIALTSKQTSGPNFRF
jgi:hypothetical protein